MSETMIPPTQEQKQTTAETLKTIAQLIRNCLFPGNSAMSVHQALVFLETAASQINPPTPTETKLEVVPDGET